MCLFCFFLFEFHDDELRKCGTHLPVLRSAKLWMIDTFRRKTKFVRLSLRPKIGSRKIPDFSLFISQILAKSRVFMIYLMGLFFPALRVEQAHFSPLTTCLTTYGDFCTIFRYKSEKDLSLRFHAKGHFLLYCSQYIFTYSPMYYYFNTICRINLFPRHSIRFINRLNFPIMPM